MPLGAADEADADEDGGDDDDDAAARIGSLPVLPVLVLPELV